MIRPPEETSSRPFLALEFPAAAAPAQEVQAEGKRGEGPQALGAPEVAPPAR